jgi:Tfp pilus assembly protein PilF
MHNALRLIAFGSLLTLNLVATAADQVATLIEQAETQLQRGETAAAITTLEAAITANPSSSLAHTRLGGAYLLDQNYRAAVDQFQQAISTDSQNASAFIGLGMAYIHLKQTGPAKAALTEARRLNPSQSADIDALLGQIEQRASAHHP